MKKEEKEAKVYVESPINYASKEDWVKTIEYKELIVVTEEEIQKMVDQALKGRFPRKKFFALSDAAKERFYDLLYSNMVFE